MDWTEPLGSVTAVFLFELASKYQLLEEGLVPYEF
jgi:hypothetical protein